MTTLDFELGRLHHTLSGIAADTGTDISAVISRLLELYGNTNSIGIAMTPLTPAERKHKPKLHRYHVVGSKAKPWHQEAIRLKKQGLSGGAIASKLNVDRTGVYTFLKQQNLTESSGYWQKMTPAERSAEMKRRRRVALAKKAQTTAA